MDDDGPTPDPTLEGGMPLPIRMAAEFPAQLFATPIEDIDPFYSDKKVRSTYTTAQHIPYMQDAKALAFGISRGTLGISEIPTLPSTNFESSWSTWSITG